MLGRNSSKPQTKRGGFFNGNVVKSKGDDAAKRPRPVHLVEGARAATTPR
jgi:hypothetical protein